MKHAHTWVEGVLLLGLAGLIVFLLVRAVGI